MDTSWLDTFCEVARRGSITAAAASLGYTQSAVSRQMAALEASMGAQLLDRQARGVELTEHGRCLLPHAEAVLNRLASVRLDLDAVDRLDSGRLRVGAFPTANAVLIPTALADFAAKHPGVSISLVEGTTHRQLANLDLGDVDLAVVSAFTDQSLDHDRFEFVHLLRDSIVLAVPRSHRLANRRSIRLSELTGESWIAGEAHNESRTLSPHRLFSEPEPSVGFQVGEWTAKLGLVAAGLGITLVPSLAAAAMRGDIALVCLHARERATRDVYAASSKRRTRSPASDAFVATLAAHASALARAVPRRAR
jgi:DNA-binding transcriptional LysR family regulator